jgi:hypothetical protein
MAYEQRDNTGAMFKNTRKENDKQPNLTGNALIEGVDYWVSGWIKVDKNNEKWISFSLKRKDGNTASGNKPAPSRQTAAELEDNDLPF